MTEPAIEVVTVEQADVDSLRRMVGEGFTDEQLAEILALTITAEGVVDLNAAAANAWGIKAAQTADLVTVTESGSSRHLSDLHKNALAMQRHFTDLAALEVVTPADQGATRRSRTRAIVRE